MVIALTVLLLAAAIAVGIAATLLVLRDTYSRPQQKVAQLLLVWLVPLIGAIVVFAVHRKLRAPSGKYATSAPPPNDLAFPKRAPQGDPDASHID